MNSENGLVDLSLKYIAKGMSVNKDFVLLSQNNTILGTHTGLWIK